MGSWNGQVIFDEPMVTRAFILAQRSSPDTAGTIAVPSARRYAPAGFHPASYGIRWEGAAGEYRIALQGPGAGPSTPPMVRNQAVTRRGPPG